MNHRANSDKSQTHIMILIPNETMRLMLRVFLNQAGYRVSVAENKQQAIRMLRDLRPDMLVIDYEHPALEPEVGKQIHEAIYPLTIPSISLIGPDLASESHRISANVCLSKPLHMDQLFKAISGLSHSSMTK